MDPSLTPWRTLEDSPGRTAETTAAGPPPGGIPRSALVAGVLAILLAGAAFLIAFGSGSGGRVAVDGGSSLAVGPSDAVSSPELDRTGATGDSSTLVVEIVGAIEHPGVFRLPTGSRIGDLVRAGGGYSPRVDADRASRDLNLAAPLRDGDQVRVPSRDDLVGPGSQPTAGSGSGGSAGGPVDLNRATAAELDALPGIGPVTATKIIASRDQQPFTATEDLRTRKLVGEKTFANLKDLVAVR